MLSALLDADATLFLWLDQLSHPAWLTGAMTVISRIGSGGAVWLAAALAIAVAGRDAAGLWRTILAVLFVLAIVDLGIKPLVDRPRPFEQHATAVAAPPAGPTSSFPSGHAATAAAGAYAVSRIASAASPALWPLAVAVALSRVYLGAHFPLDVVSGWMIGLAGGVFVTGGLTYRPRPAR